MPNQVFDRYVHIARAHWSRALLKHSSDGRENPVVASMGIPDRVLSALGNGLRRQDHRRIMAAGWRGDPLQQGFQGSRGVGMVSGYVHSQQR